MKTPISLEHEKLLVSQNGLALKNASKKSRDNDLVVLAAVTQNGLALMYASERLKSNQAIVLAAVAQNGKAFKHASLDLQKNKLFFLEALKKNPSSNFFVPKPFNRYSAPHKLN